MQTIVVYISLIFFTVVCIKCSGDNGSIKTLDTENRDSESGKNVDELKGSEKPPMIDWVRIESGSFIFGSPATAPCTAPSVEDEIPVILTRPFYVASTEITQAQWEAMSLSNPSWTKGDKKPVTLINFFEAALWCNKLSRLEGLDTCYDLSQCKNPIGTGCEIDDTRTGHACGKVEIVFYCEGNIHKYANRYSCPGYRLPTTAEWEYAAKAGILETHTYGGDIFGEQLGACGNQTSLNDISWYCFNSNNEVQDVGRKLPNPWGLYDTLGNVNEIVDYFDKNLPLDGGIKAESLTDPIGPTSGTLMEGQTRGGDFSLTGCMVKPSGQFNRELTQRAYHTGFRPVRTIFE